MTFTLTFKTPDVADQLPNQDEAFLELVQKYVKWGEIIQVEFDTETGEAKVLET